MPDDEIEPMKMTVPWIPSEGSHRPLPWALRCSAIRAIISIAQYTGATRLTSSTRRKFSIG